MKRNFDKHILNSYICIIVNQYHPNQRIRDWREPLMKDNTSIKRCRFTETSKCNLAPRRCCHLQLPCLYLIQPQPHIFSQPPLLFCLFLTQDPSLTATCPRYHKNKIIYVKNFHRKYQKPAQDDENIHPNKGNRSRELSISALLLFHLHFHFSPSFCVCV